jgi:hypothetical protein
MKYKQCKLKSGNEHMVTCLPDEPKLKVGVKVSLKDSENPKQWWLVESMGNIALEKDDIKGSHNSKNWHKNDFRGKLTGLNIKS